MPSTLPVIQVGHFLGKFRRMAMELWFSSFGNQWHHALQWALTGIPERFLLVMLEAPAMLPLLEG